MKQFVTLLLFLSMIIVSGCVTDYSNDVKMRDTSIPVPEDVINFGKEDRVMVFAAHQDDEAIGAATIMSRTVKSGGDITLVMTTDGAPKEFGHGEFEENLRKGETKKAMALIGIPEHKIIFLDYDDLGFVLEIDVDKEIERISDLISSVNPTQIYVHAYEGGHIDHDATHYLVTEAVKELKMGAKVYEFPEYNAFYWGQPIPEDKDVIDNDEYPVITLNLTDEEKNTKKEMIKQYISQHPVKANLIRREGGKGMEILQLSIDVNGENKNLNEIKRGDDHYIQLGHIDYESIIPTQFTTDFMFERGNYDYSSNEILEFILNGYDLFRFPYSYIACDDIPNEDKNYVLRRDKQIACLNDNPGLTEIHCQVHELKEMEGAKYCEETKDALLNILNEMKSEEEFYKNLFPEGIPQHVIDNLRYGTYYKKVKPDYENFIGTLQVRPDSLVQIIMEIGNTLDTHLRNVTVSMKLEGHIKSLTILGALDAAYREETNFFDIAPKTIKLEEFEIFFPFHSQIFEDYIYNLVIEVTGSGEDGKTYSEKKILGIHFKKEEIDGVILDIGNDTWRDEFIEKGYMPKKMPGQGSDICVGLMNTGKGNLTETVIVEIEALSIKEISNESCYNNICKPYVSGPQSGNVHCIPLDMTNAPPGEYKVNVYLEYNGKILDQKDATLFMHENGYYEIIEYRIENEFDLFFSKPELKEEIHMEDCDEDDYLVCLFYWPDMVRELPPYDYGRMPHQTPPDLLYESSYEEMGTGLNFESFHRSIEQ